MWEPLSGCFGMALMPSDDIAPAVNPGKCALNSAAVPTISSDCLSTLLRRYEYPYVHCSECFVGGGTRASGTKLAAAETSHAGKRVRAQRSRALCVRPLRQVLCHPLRKTAGSTKLAIATSGAHRRRCANPGTDYTEQQWLSNVVRNGRATRATCTRATSHSVQISLRSGQTPYKCNSRKHQFNNVHCSYSSS